MTCRPASKFCCWVEPVYILRIYDYQLQWPRLTSSMQPRVHCISLSLSCSDVACKVRDGATQLSSSLQPPDSALVVPSCIASTNSSHAETEKLSHRVAIDTLWHGRMGSWLVMQSVWSFIDLRFPDRCHYVAASQGGSPRKSPPRYVGSIRWYFGLKL